MNRTRLDEVDVLDARVLGIFLQESSTQFKVPRRRIPSSLNFDLDVHTTGFWQAAYSLVSVDVETKLQILDAEGSPGVPSPQNSTVLGTMTATFEAQIVVADHHKHVMDQDRAEGFARTQGLPMVYPYVRQYLSENIGRAGLPPLFLPLLEQGQQEPQGSKQ